MADWDSLGKDWSKKNISNLILAILTLKRQRDHSMVYIYYN